ncbi:DNA-binding protein [Salinisphaera orenii]|uniref:DNA-binding protein n=1 Tax=Salinisphaera orenii TaxID=856731 RepID=UPI000DBE3D77
MISEWFTASDLAGLPKMPATDRGVRKAAVRESWQSRKCEIGKGLEYHIDSLPSETRTAIAAQATHVETEHARAGRAAAAKQKIAADQTQNATLAASADGLARLATLTGHAKDRAEARLAILDALAAFTCRSDKSKTAALQAFVAYFNDGAIDCADWIREQLGTISVASLYRWQKAAKTEGAARLSGNYGNRKGAGKIDSQPEIKEYAEAMLGEYPHLRGKQLYESIRARFGGSDHYTIPSQSACERWLKRWKAQNPSLYTALANPDAWKSNYMPAFGSASEDVARLNQRWELDSTPADVLLADGRHSVIGVIDVFSRRAKLLVSRTSTSQAVAGVVRRAILDWGVPESVKNDNGSDYKSHHLTRIWEFLGVAQYICNPYSGWEKPHIERFFKTFSHDLIELLPGYAGHNVGERQAIEQQKAFADRLMTRGETIEIGMTAGELQTFCDRWCESVYEQRPHAGLDSRTPMQAAAGQPFQAIDNERALDILLARAPGDGQRVVGKKGISIDGRAYIAPELGDHIGQPVQVLYDEADVGRIHVMADLGAGWEYLCVAECPEITGISRQAVAQRTRELSTGEVQRQRAEIKRAAKKHKTADVAEDMLAERERAAGRVTALPGRSEAAESDALAAADRAVAASDAADQADDTPERLDDDTRQRLQAQIEAEETARRELTPKEQFAAWQQMIARTEPGDAERRDWQIFETSNAFRVRYEAAYGDEFEGHASGAPHEDDAATPRITTATPQKQEAYQ